MDSRFAMANAFFLSPHLLFAMKLKRRKKALFDPRMNRGKRRSD